MKRENVPVHRGACVRACVRAWMYARADTRILEARAARMHADARERADRTKRTHVLHASACTVRARTVYATIAVLMHDRGSAGSRATTRKRIRPRSGESAPAAPPARGDEDDLVDHPASSRWIRSLLTSGGEGELGRNGSGRAAHRTP